MERKPNPATRRLAAALAAVMALQAAVPAAQAAPIKAAPIVHTGPAGSAGAAGVGALIVPRAAAPIHLNNVSLTGSGIGSAGLRLLPLRTMVPSLSAPIRSAAPSAVVNAIPTPKLLSLPNSAIPGVRRNLGIETGKSAGQGGAEKAPTSFGVLRETSGKIAKVGVPASAGVLRKLYEASSQSDSAVDSVSNSFLGPYASRRTSPLNPGKVHAPNLFEVEESVRTSLLAASDPKPVFQAKTGDLKTARSAILSAPNGSPLNVRVTRTTEDYESLVQNRSSLPGNGVLEVLPEGSDFDIWNKNILVPLDYVVLDAHGLVTKVFPRTAPAAPGTSWRKIPILSARGSYVLALPAGRAEALGAVPGAEFAALEAPAETNPVADPASLAEAVLEGGERGLSTAVKFFRETPHDRGVMEETLDIVKVRIREARRARAPKLGRYREALSKFFDRVAGELDSQGAYEGMLSSRFPGLWLSKRHGSATRLMGLPVRLFGVFVTFFHELGHYFMGRALGLKAAKFRVFLSGSGFVSFDGKASGLKRFLIDIAGPVMGFGISLGVFALAASTAVTFWPAAAALLQLGPAAVPLTDLVTIFSAFFLAGASMIRGISELRGAHWDLVSALSNLGFKRFAWELEWRERQRVRGRFGRMGYFSLWRSMFSRPSLTPQALDAAPAEAAPFAEGLLTASRGNRGSRKSTPKKSAKPAPLARRLRADPGLDDSLRENLERLSGLLRRTNLTDEMLYWGLNPYLARRQRRFYQWLKQQVMTQGDLPLFEMIGRLKSTGYYDEATGLSLISKRRNASLWDRVSTMVHEAYHRWANLEGLPMREEGRPIQERDALIAELILWSILDGAGEARPSGDAAVHLRSMRGGHTRSILAAVERDYTGEEGRPGGKTLRRELESRLAELTALREKGFSGMKKLEAEAASEMLERRIAAIKSFLKE